MTMKRREFLGAAGAAAVALRATAQGRGKRPNILFYITDDQSWIHCSAYGSKMVHTPNFDRVAHEGILFGHAYVSVPSCNPSRASVLTGRPFYQLREACMNHTPWPKGLTVYTDLLADAGYHAGYTGKGCDPTGWQGVRPANPAGPVYNDCHVQGENRGIDVYDYAANFDAFLDARPEGAPFCFWYGSKEPHRPFQTGIGLRTGKKLEDAEVPPFFPDSPEIRSDLLDYATHIEWADLHFGRMLARLESLGELENTLVVATADNGMAFPRAKATCYEYGIHMPLAIRWGARVKGGRMVSDFIQHCDFAPTFLEAAGLPVPAGMTGKSLMPILESTKSGRIDPTRDHVVVGVERHFPGGRASGLGYPVRAIRSERYLYIDNLAPDRWPMGDPDSPVWPADDPTGGFGDCDGSPAKTYICAHKEDQSKYYEQAFGKNPPEQLFDVEKDPVQLDNLAGNSEYARLKEELADKMHRQLKATKDPREIGEGDRLDGYAVKYQTPLGAAPKKKE